MDDVSWTRLKYLGGAVLLLFILLVAGCTSKNPTNKTVGENLAQQFALQIPETKMFVPDFNLENLNQEIVSLRDYRGKIVLLTFTTSW